MMAFRFLLLEDNSLNAEVVRVTLADSGIDCELQKVETRSSFEAALSTDEFDLILADYALPGFDGLSALKIASNLRPDVPFIFVSATMGEELAIEALKQGATDYILKQRLGRLVPAVRRALQEAEERRTRQRTELLLVEQKRLLESIASGHPMDECLAAVCTAMSRLNPGARICFLLSDPQGLKFPHSITPDFPPSFKQGLKDAPIDDLCIGTCGEAVYRGQPISCADIANDDRWSQEWRDLCVAHGILACHSSPVLGLGGLPFGSLMLCFDEPRLPTDWEYQLVEFATQVARIVFERERASFAQRQSEERFRAIVNQVTAGIAQTDLTGQFVLVNQRYCDLVGYSKEELLHERMQDLIHPDDRPHSIALFQQLVTQGREFVIEKRYLRKDGSEVWVNNSVSLVRDPSGNPQFVVAVVLDVSEAKRRELNEQFLNQLDRRLRQLRETQGMLQEMVSSLGQYLKVDRCILSEIDGQQGLLTVVGEWCPNLLKSTGTYSLSDFLTPEFQASLTDGQPAAVNDVTGDPRTADRASNYEPFQVRAFASVPCIYQGHWVAVLSVNSKTPRGWREDELTLLQETVTRVWPLIEQMQAEEALAANEAKLRGFVEANVVGMLYGDIYGNIWQANDELLRIVGYTREDLAAGRLRWIDITPPEHLPLDERAIAQAKARGACTPYEKEYIRKDGSRVPVLLGYSLVGEAREESVAFILDLSDRKQAELQLQRQASELRQLNLALEKTTFKLTERNQELDRFTYTVSHDLKAPLRAISNLSQWIEDDLVGQLDEENLRQMKLLRQRVGRLEDMIDGLLAYCRIGRTEVTTEKVDVGELLWEILDSLAPPPTFTIAISPQMPSLLTKRLLLSQIFSNLIGNAIKHHRNPDGQIEIGVTRQGEYYEFSVADDGPGIAPENHDRVFDLFQTLKGRDVKESTGIGLSIVRRIVENEGGSIVLESQLGKGSTFRFTWPLQQP